MRLATETDTVTWVEHVSSSQCAVRGSARDSEDCAGLEVVASKLNSTSPFLGGGLENNGQRSYYKKKKGSPRKNRGKKKGLRELFLFGYFYKIK